MNVPQTTEGRLRAALEAIVTAREENAISGGSHDLIEAALETAEIELGVVLEEATRDVGATNERLSQPLDLHDRQSTHDLLGRGPGDAELVGKMVANLLDACTYGKAEVAP